MVINLDVIIKVLGRNEELCLALEKLKIAPKKVKNGIIINLSSEAYNTYTIPKILQNINKIIYVNLMETRTDNYAQIICSPQGDPIFPYYKRGKEAYFSIKWGAAIVYAYKDEKGRVEISIEQIKINNLGDKVIVDQWELFDGEELSPELSRFEKAVKSALSKMRCVNCSEPHYIRT